MRYFTNVHDLGDLKTALAEAFEIKKDRYKYENLGKHKTCLLIFFNNSLRTRLSTKAHGSWKQSAVSLWMATRANTCWKLFR